MVMVMVSPYTCDDHTGSIVQRFQREGSGNGGMGMTQCVCVLANKFNIEENHIVKASFCNELASF
jgi:L-cysteine desulfidase